MKLLLITDTHGDLDCINLLASRTGADAVLHSGDLGFYDEGSPERLTTRELILRIIHSHLPQEKKKAAKKLSRPEMIAFIRRQSPLSELPDYLRGEKQFSLPVYAVWGNHEDNVVVEKFYSGEYSIDNFHVLHEKQSFRLGDFHIFGLGGNVIINEKFFDRPIAGNGGRVWSTFTQFVELVRTVKRNRFDNEICIFVSHVSPGKEPFASLIGAHSRADYIISGHMGPPFSMVWNEFAIREIAEASARISGRLDDVVAVWNKLRTEIRDANFNRDAEGGLRQLCDFPTERGGRGSNRKVSRWYRDMININLPDAEIGYSILEEKDGAVSLTSYARRYSKNVFRDNPGCLEIS